MRSHRRWAVALFAVAIGAFLLPTAIAATGATPPTGQADRISGQNRYETSAKIAQKIPLGVHYVVLARGDFFADALAAAPLTLDNSGDFAPVLLTPSGSLDSNAKTEIDRRLDPGDHVKLIGGSAALSPSIDAALVAAGYHADRLTSYANGSSKSR